MIKFQEERISLELLEEAKPLLFSHWQELANNKDKIPLDPDYENYILLNSMGVIKAYTMRKDDVLKGYVTLVITPHLHHKGFVYALVDIYFIDPELRKQGYGFTFFQQVEESLKNIGIKSILSHDQIKHSNQLFFEKLGFNLVEQVYEKVI